MELYSIVFLLGLSGISYVLIFVRLSARKHRNQQKSSELRILLQAILISVYTSSVVIGWHTYSLFLPDSKWTVFAMNLMWIVNCGISPTLYLVLNKTLQNSFFNYVCLRSPVFPNDSKVLVLKSATNASDLVRKFTTSVR
ncbi:hypothetical protein L596_028523 [Steinernema carpocapsae]|uniref:Uncharacterized protein n=1 Tax=Steinernema carpocapsae TaxID=34508 RepID=A0A4U5LYN9_STECR|nr:hypothetical protein L596_028523 [Steinernema carpocapsae]